MRRIMEWVLLAVIVTLVGAWPSLAYIDPSTGGMLFQLLAVLFGLFSGLVLFFSRQIRVLFARGMRYLRSLARTSAESAEARDPGVLDSTQ